MLEKCSLFSFSEITYTPVLPHSRSPRNILKTPAQEQPVSRKTFRTVEKYFVPNVDPKNLKISKQSPAVLGLQNRELRAVACAFSGVATQVREPAVMALTAYISFLCYSPN